MQIDICFWKKLEKKKATNGFWPTLMQGQMDPICCFYAALATVASFVSVKAMAI